MISKKEKEEIIKILEIENLKEEDQDKILENLKENIERSVSLMILDTLKEEDKKELEQIIFAEKDDRIYSFLKSKNPLLSSLIKATAVFVVDDFKRLRNTLS